MITTESQEEQELEVAQEENAFITNAIINSATNCLKRGKDPVSGKRGVCHVFRRSDVCMCGEIDLSKFRLK